MESPKVALLHQQLVLRLLNHGFASLAGRDSQDVNHLHVNYVLYLAVYIKKLMLEDGSI